MPLPARAGDWAASAGVCEDERRPARTGNASGTQSRSAVMNAICRFRGCARQWARDRVSMQPKCDRISRRSAAQSIRARPLPRRRLFHSCIDGAPAADVACGPMRFMLAPRCPPHLLSVSVGGELRSFELLCSANRDPTGKCIVSDSRASAQSARSADSTVGAADLFCLLGAHTLGSGSASGSVGFSILGGGRGRQILVWARSSSVWADKASPSGC